MDIKNYRLQKMYINLQEIKFKFQHIHCENNSVADALSKAPNPHQDSEEANLIIVITSNN